MSRSLLWIEDSTFTGKLSELTRPLSSNDSADPNVAADTTEEVRPNHPAMPPSARASETAALRGRGPTSSPSTRKPTSGLTGNPTSAATGGSVTATDAGDNPAVLPQRPIRRRRPNSPLASNDTLTEGIKPPPPDAPTDRPAPPVSPPAAGRPTQRRTRPLPVASPVARPDANPEAPSALSTEAPESASTPSPWQMTPAQPWSAVAGPRDTKPEPTEIPRLTYPVGLGLSPRLELFRKWVKQHCSTGAFFVSDQEGLPLLLEGISTSQAVTAVAFDRALHPLRGLLGTRHANALCVELDDGRMVQMIWAGTHAARIAVGISTSRPLGPAATARVRQALQGLFGDGEA